MVNSLYSSSNVNSSYNSASAIERLATEITRSSRSKQIATSDALTSTQKRLAASMLDDSLNPMAVAYHNIFSTTDEIQEYIYNKYFENSQTRYYEQYDSIERYAMYQNDVNAVLYGLDENNTDFNDPRLNFSAEDWARINTYSSDLERLNAQMLEILRENRIQADEDAYFVIEFNPYNYQVDITSDEDESTIRAFKNALNKNSNSKDFFIYALQHANSLNQDSVDKMQAYQNIFRYTGEDLKDLNLVDGNFYNSNGENILDVMKNNMQNLYLNNPFTDSLYSQTENLLQNIARYGWNNIPDLELSMIYSMREGIFVPGVVYNI